MPLEHPLDRTDTQMYKQVFEEWYYVMTITPRVFARAERLMQNSSNSILIQSDITSLLH